MMKYYIVDCFAQEKYQGNQLLVVIPDRELSAEEMQKIAREINFSETSFILSGKKEDGTYDVRIFTPNSGEVPFAGHPSIGTACIIHRYLENQQNNIVGLNLKVGVIPIRFEDDCYIMSQNPPVFGDTVSKEEIAEVFGVDAAKIDDDYPIQWVSTGLEAVIVCLKDRETLSEVRTDKEKFRKYIRRYPANNCNHLFFTAMGNNVFAARCLMEDFLEDPATGSANGDLLAYLLKHDYYGKKEISYSVIQGEDMGRRSVLYMHGSCAEEKWLLEVGGKCHIVAKGEWE